MPRHPPDVNPTWVIRSVAVRTRDGPERLDQAYRCLMDSPSCDDTSFAPGCIPERAGVTHTPEPRK